MTKHQLSIHLYGKPVGLLEQNTDGKMQFKYDDDAKTPISINMPLRTAIYEHQVCEAFFGGLLPESEVTRKIIGKRFGVSANNSFSLLKVIGYDCAGAISCHALSNETIMENRYLLTAKIISDDELYRHIKELPKKPLFIDVEGLRLSLAGVHDKAAVCLIDNQIALAEEGCPTTHILKPTPIEYPGLAENEFFCLRVAALIGLPIPSVEIRKVKDQTYLLVERYDRRIFENKVERIHQEDFCQGLGILSTNKYQNEGGPGLADCFRLLMQTLQPAVDRNVLTAGILFNYLIGNMDAHGKNFSLLHHSNSNIRLSPFYDLICTRAYDELSTKMAMKIGSRYDADEVLPRHWEQFCKDVSYRYVALKKLMHQMSTQIIIAAEQVRQEMKVTEMDHPIIDKIITNINKNIDQLAKNLT